MPTGRPTPDDGGSPLELTAALAERHQRSLVMFAMRQLEDAGLAEEAAQETLRRVHDALRKGRVRDEQALPAFLHQTLRNVCLQKRAKLGRERRALKRLGAEPRPRSVEAESLTALVREERRLAVRAALARLGPSDRDLLEALFVHDLDPAELARRLDVSPSALRVRKHRALRRLAAALAAPSPSDPAGNERRPGGTY